jgi:glutathione peroxidase
MLKSVYPALTSITRFFGVNSRVVLPEEKNAPVVSLYDIPFETIAGEQSSLAAYKGKKIVVVNTASDCGYTGQYEELQTLYAQAKGEIMIVGFPANDFKAQEKGSNEQIASFCKKNYGVEFPIAAKASVVKGSNQHPVFAWLSDPAKNGWNKEAPAWNFSKYIIDEEGKLIGYFDPGVSPLGKDFLKALNISIP